MAGASRLSDHGRRRARSPPPLAPVHAAARLGERGAAGDRARRGHRPDRRRRPPLHRRRLLAVVQRPRAPPPAIDEAVREQLDRVAHSTMLGLTHAPAAELAERLVELAPPGLDRVFYSDSGSTATEIALKMAFQYWQQRGGQHGGGPRSSASATPTTATRSARSRSAASTSSTPPTARCCSRRIGSPPATRAARARARLPRGGDRRGDRRAAGPGRRRDPGPAARLPARVRELCDATACC